MEWKLFEIGYEVSICGRIRSLDRTVIRSDNGANVRIRGIELEQQIDDCGYLRTQISLNGESITVKVHRVVAKAFIPNPENLPQVNHKDGNKMNNKVENLEWTNNSGNQIHAIKTGLKEIKFATEATAFTGSVQVFDKHGILTYTLSGNKEMEDHGFDFRLISMCLTGKRNTHKGCTFKKLIKEIK